MKKILLIFLLLIPLVSAYTMDNSSFYYHRLNNFSDTFDASSLNHTIWYNETTSNSTQSNASVFVKSGYIQLNANQEVANSEGSYALLQNNYILNRTNEYLFTYNFSSALSYQQTTKPATTVSICRPNTGFDISLVRDGEGGSANCTWIFSRTNSSLESGYYETYLNTTANNFYTYTPDGNLNTTHASGNYPGGFQFIISVSNLNAGSYGNLTLNLYDFNLYEIYDAVNISHYNTVNGLKISPTCTDNLSSLVTNLYNPRQMNTEIECVLTGYEDKTEQFSMSNGSAQTINMTPLMFDMYFLDFDGSTKTVSGQITDVNKTVYFAEPNYTIAQVNLSEGIVRLAVQQTSGGYTNYTNFYEYENDLETNVQENITILEGDTKLMYFKMYDESNKPLSYAQIRLSQTNATTGESTFKFIGQRLTNPDGGIWFYVEEDRDLKIVAYKENYGTWLHTITVSEYRNHSNEDDPYVIILPSASTSYKDNIYLGLPSEFSDRTEDIIGVLIANDRSNITLIPNMGSFPNNLQVTDDGTLTFTLESGTHFSESGVGNITLDIYVDEELYKSVQITYKTVTDILDKPTDTNETIVRAMAFIVLIIVSTGVGIIFRNQSQTSGFHTFMVGGILMGIFVTGAGYLILINSLYYVLRIIRKMIGE